MTISRILIVDDDAPQRKVHAGYFEGHVAERFSFDGIVSESCSMEEVLYTSARNTGISE